MLAVGLAFAAPATGYDGDAGAIRHLMMTTFNTPEAPLIVEPITIFRNIAVVGWVQGEKGGRALLRRHGSESRLTLCSGDALKEAKSLQHFGLTIEEAEAMAKAVTDAEAKLAPTLVVKFSTFDGVVQMDGDGHHPPIDGHGDNRDG